MLKCLLINNSDFKTNKKIGNNKNIIILLLISLNILFTNQTKTDSGFRFMGYRIWTRFKELSTSNEFPTVVKKKADEQNLIGWIRRVKFDDKKKASFFRGELYGKIENIKNVQKDWDKLHSDLHETEWYLQYLDDVKSMPKKYMKDGKNNFVN